MGHPISQQSTIHLQRKTSKYMRYGILFVSFILALCSSSIILLVGYEILRPYHPTFTVPKTALLALGFNRPEVAIVYYHLKVWSKGEGWGSMRHPLSALPIVVLGGAGIGLIAGFKSTSGPGVHVGTGALGAFVVGFTVLSMWTAVRCLRQKMRKGEGDIQPALACP